MPYCLIDWANSRMTLYQNGVLAVVNWELMSQLAIFVPVQSGQATDQYQNPGVTGYQIPCLDRVYWMIV